MRSEVGRSEVGRSEVNKFGLIYDFIMKKISSKNFRLVKNIHICDFIVYSI